MANQLVAQDVTFAGKAGQLKAYVAHQGGGAPAPGGYRGAGMVGTRRPYPRRRAALRE